MQTVAPDYSSPHPTPDYGGMYPVAKINSLPRKRSRSFLLYSSSITTALLFSPVLISQAIAAPGDTLPAPIYRCATDLSTCEILTGGGTGMLCNPPPPASPSCDSAHPFLHSGSTCCSSYACTIPLDRNGMSVGNPFATDMYILETFSNCMVPTPAPAPPPVSVPGPVPAPAAPPAPAPAPAAAPLGYMYGGAGIEWWPAPTPAPAPSPGPASSPAPAPAPSGVLVSP